MVRGRTLYVTIEDSVWAQQLSMAGHDLACRINEAIGAPVLERIRFRTGQVRPALAWKASEEKANAELYAEQPVSDDMDPVALSGVEPTHRRDGLIRKIVDGIGDPEVRSRFEQLLTKDSQWQQWQRLHMSPGAEAVANVLRREPWLDDAEVRSLSAVNPELATATSGDMERARRVVVEECADEVDALARAGGLETPQGRVRVRIMVECMTMLGARCRPGEVTDELVSRWAGPTYVEHLRRARGHGGADTAGSLTGANAE